MDISLDDQGQSPHLSLKKEYDPTIHICRHNISDDHGATKKAA